MTTITASPAVTLNPSYGMWIRGQILALQVPGGFWAVKVRQVADRWVAFAVPRHGTTGGPFLIGHGDAYPPVLLAGIKWADSATVSVMRLDRIVFAGNGNATEETLPDFDPTTLVNAAVAA